MESAWCNEPPLALDTKLLLFVLTDNFSTALEYWAKLTRRHLLDPRDAMETNLHQQPTRLQAFGEPYRYSQWPPGAGFVTGYQIATSLVSPSSVEQASFLQVSCLPRPTLADYESVD
jgi:hypothetical protein